MTLSNGPIVLHRTGGPSRVIQGFFPGGQPRLPQLATAGTPPPSATPPRPNPVQARQPATVQPAIVPGRPGAILPASKPGFPANKPQPVLPAPARPGAVQPFTGAKAIPPQPILPAAPKPAAVQPRSGNAFALPPSFHLRASGTGQRLPEAVQQKMEEFFGASFADVRVHVGNEASSIGASAFTHGADLYFAPGQYNPQTPQGQQLLGHELTHVVQQRAGRVRNPLGSGVAVVQDPALEAEAERMALRVALFPKAAQPTMGRGTASKPVVLPKLLAGQIHPGARKPRPQSVQEPIQAFWFFDGNDVVWKNNRLWDEDLYETTGARNWCPGFGLPGRKVFKLRMTTSPFGHTYKRDQQYEGVRNKIDTNLSLDLDDPTAWPADGPGQIEMLFRKFQRFDFTYSMNASGYDAVVKNKRGDCKGLCNLFQVIAAKEFGIAVVVDSNAFTYLTMGEQTIDPSASGNCDDGMHWFFQNHFWVNYNGTQYDLLFGKKRNPAAAWMIKFKSVAGKEGEHESTSLEFPDARVRENRACDTSLPAGHCKNAYISNVG